MSINVSASSVISSSISSKIMISSSVSFVNFDGVTKVFTFLFPFFCDNFGVSNLLFDGVFRVVTDGVFRGVIDGNFRGAGVFHGEETQ